MDRFLRTAVMVVFLFPSLAEDLDAQGTSDLEDRPASRRLSFTLDLGGTVGGPAGSLADQLRDAGFGDTSPAGCFLFWCSGPTSHPTRDRPEVHAGVGVRYALTPSLTLGAGFSNSSLGGSTGFRKYVPGSGAGDYVHSHWDMSIVRAEAYWTPTPTVRLGGGPALYRLTGPFPHSERGFSRLGATVGAGTALPVHSRFFLDLSARLGIIPSRDVEHVVGSAEILILRPRWTHATLTAGLGLRL